MVWCLKDVCEKELHLALFVLIASAILLLLKFFHFIRRSEPKKGRFSPGGNCRLQKGAGECSANTKAVNAPVRRLKANPKARTRQARAVENGERRVSRCRLNDASQKRLAIISYGFTDLPPSLPLLCRAPCSRGSRNLKSSPGWGYGISRRR